MVARLTDGPFRVRREPLRWVGQDPQHLVEVTSVTDQGGPLDAQGVCSCGWATLIYDQYAATDSSYAETLPVGRVPEFDSGWRAAREALEHGGYNRREHEGAVRRLARQLAEDGLGHRNALEVELAAYDEIGRYVAPRPATS